MLLPFSYLCCECSCESDKVCVHSHSIRLHNSLPQIQIIIEDEEDNTVSTRAEEEDRPSPGLNRTSGEPAGPGPSSIKVQGEIVGVVKNDHSVDDYTVKLRLKDGSLVFRPSADVDGGCLHTFISTYTKQMTDLATGQPLRIPLINLGKRHKRETPRAPDVQRRFKLIKKRAGRALEEKREDLDADFVKELRGMGDEAIRGVDVVELRRELERVFNEPSPPARIDLSAEPHGHPPTEESLEDRIRRLFSGGGSADKRVTAVMRTLDVLIARGDVELFVSVPLQYIPASESETERESDAPHAIQ